MIIDITYNYTDQVLIIFHAPAPTKNPLKSKRLGLVQYINSTLLLK